MKILIYKEKQGELTRVADVTVPDNSSDPEGAGWNAYTRGDVIPEGTYVAIRAGKRFRASHKTQNQTVQLGSMG